MSSAGHGQYNQQLVLNNKISSVLVGNTGSIVHANMALSQLYSVTYQ